METWTCRNYRTRVGKALRVSLKSLDLVLWVVETRFSCLCRGLKGTTQIPPMTEPGLKPGSPRSCPMHPGLRGLEDGGHLGAVRAVPSRCLRSVSQSELALCWSPACHRGPAGWPGPFLWLVEKEYKTLKPPVLCCSPLPGGVPLLLTLRAPSTQKVYLPLEVKQGLFSPPPHMEV